MTDQRDEVVATILIEMGGRGSGTLKHARDKCVRIGCGRLVSLFLGGIMRVLRTLDVILFPCG